ncbi:MAG: tRNA (N(6)-L-threonylcarbamoyladenosine(37)-C(2))-methylthiotransferase MtaB [Chlorobi bacterium]|nr:tRNA (N(6)-L-threonylcarbamoyladenosine(37)-C(2))-methylthiotransferase MtaB [Chlorobiota bacterium]
MREGPPKKIAFTTLGCKLNFAETSAIASRVRTHRRTDFSESADVYVVNTCTVTANAERKLRELVRRVKSRNPEAKVVAIGCFAQRDSEAVAAIEGVDLVLGMAEKYRLPELLPALERGELPRILNEKSPSEAGFFPAYSAGDRTRAFLKIQEGCDYPCTYCVIPAARGKGRNPTVEEIVAQAEEIAGRGIREIVLTGVNIGTFRDRSGPRERRFIDLIRALDQVEGIDRYRISSIEPNLLTDEIIRFVLKESRAFLPHFHIPLQSGSNEILGRMKRRYRRELYADKVRKIKELNPDAAVGADVITGFPGETDELFRETYAFLKELPVSYLHVFPYSPRPGTEASRMKGQVPRAEIKRRSALLRELSDRKQMLFIQSQLGQVRPVLFEQTPSDGRLAGWTDNYIRVVRPFRKDWINRIVPVRLDRADGLTVLSENA